MFMQKIEASAVACNLFDITKGFDGNGGSAIDRGTKPRSANEDEARAYADFIRRKNGLPDLGEPDLQHIGGYTGRGRTCHFFYAGATYGEEISRGEYEAGAFSVLFPGANMMRATVTLETLDDAGEVVSSQTMPVEPKKGGVVWSRHDVRKAAGPVAKPAKVAKVKRPPTVAKRRAAPTVDKRRRAVMRALQLRAALRRSRDIAHDRLCQLAENARQNAAKRAARPDAPATAPDAILSDLAAAADMMRSAGYVPMPADATPTAIQLRKRTPAHERAIKRAWAERKAARDAALVATYWESSYRDEHAAKSRAKAHATDCFRSYMIGKDKRRRAVLKARDLQNRLYAEHRLVDRANDRRRLAEQEAAEALAMREEMRALLDATEARLAAAEAENAQLWGEIEGLTAPAEALAA